MHAHFFRKWFISKTDNMTYVNHAFMILLLITWWSNTIFHCQIKCIRINVQHLNFIWYVKILKFFTSNMTLSSQRCKYYILTGNFKLKVIISSIYSWIWQFLQFGSFLRHPDRKISCFYMYATHILIVQVLITKLSELLRNQDCSLIRDKI